MRKRVVKYIKTTGLNYVNTYRREKSECKLPELTEIAKFTVRSSKRHNTLQTLIIRVLCLQTVYQQCCKARPPELLVVYLSTFLFAQVLIRSERDVSLQETDHFSFNQFSFSDFVCHGHFGCAADAFYVRNERSRFQTEKRNIAKANRNFHVHVLTREKDLSTE